MFSSQFPSSPTSLVVRLYPLSLYSDDDGAVDGGSMHASTTEGTDQQEEQSDKQTDSGVDDKQDTSTEEVSDNYQ